MKQLRFLLPACLLCAMLCACSLPPRPGESAEPESTVLSQRMVEQVEASFHPDPTVISRVYTHQNTLNPLMRILRGIHYDQPIREDESLDQCESYFSFTIRYSSGVRQDYRLLAHRYLRVGSEGWYEISADDALLLTEFLEQHDSDTGFLPDPEPAEPTLPEEVK